jgi:hypothetical protein
VNVAGARSIAGAAVVSVGAGAVSTVLFSTVVTGVAAVSSPAQAARRATQVRRGMIRRDGTRRVWQAEW